MIRVSAHARCRAVVWLCLAAGGNLPLQVTSLPSPSLSSLPEPLHRRPTMPCHACSNQFSPCNVAPVCYSRPTMFMFQPPSTMFSVSSSQLLACPPVSLSHTCLGAEQYEPSLASHRRASSLSLLNLPSFPQLFVCIFVCASSVWATDKPQFNSAVQATLHFNSSTKQFYSSTVQFSGVPCQCSLPACLPVSLSHTCLRAEQSCRSTFTTQPARIPARLALPCSAQPGPFLTLLCLPLLPFSNLSHTPQHAALDP